jgi:hypothetical protein
MPKHTTDIWKKTHVQHPVGLIQNQNFNRWQGSIGMLEVIEETPWGCHQDFGSIPERVFLRTHPDTPENGLHPKPREAGQLLALFFDLGC